MSLFIITGGKAMCKLLLENFTFAGLKGSLYECQPESLKDIIAHKDFYIRKTLDTRHAEELAKSLREGEDLPPVVVCTVKEISQKRIINGNHTAYAHILAQKPAVRVLDLGELPFEDAFKLQAQLNHQGKILSIKPEDIKHYAQLLYRSFRSELLGKRDRNTAIQKVALILSKTERMVYNYLADILKQEDEELRKRALELFRQEYKTQTEIAQILGIDQTTVSKWLSEDANNSQEKTLTKQLCIFEITSKNHNLKPSLNNLNGDFLKLLNTYFESGNQRLTGFYDWAKEKGYEISKEEWDEFRRQVEVALRKVLILNIRKTEKEIKLLMERELQAIPRPAREWIVASYLELAYARMLKEAKAFEGLIKEVCEDLEVEDILGELRKRAEKRDLVYVKQNFNLFVAVYEDVINKCKEKYPVLRLEDIEDRLEVLIELESKEEIEKELKAEFVNYRVPKAIVEEIWKRKTEKIRAELLQRARAIKDYGEFKDWLNSLQGHQKELSQNISEIREIEKALKEKHDREVLQRLVEEIKSLKHMDYASLVDSLSEEDKDVAIRYRKDLERVFAELERPKAEDVEKLIEEGLSDE
ncbi:MAG: helix-turn-helix domain-containing protein, partial [Desulfurococcaceae archaeon]